MSVKLQTRGEVWDCPTGFGEMSAGAWRVAHEDRPAGRYPLFKIMGYDYLQMPAFRVNALQEYRDGTWRTWMTDEPLYFYSMANYAAKSTGRVLVLGLGLGMVLRHLKENSRVEGVTVIERQQEVIDLIWSKLPLDRRFRLETGDFFDLAPELGKQKFDTIIADLWTGKPTNGLFQQLFLRVYDTIQTFWPDARAYYHGVDPWARLLRELRVRLPDEDRLRLLSEEARKWSRRA